MKSLGLSRYALAMGAAAALLAGCGEAQPAAHKGVGRGVRINGCVMGTKATIDTPFNVKGAWLSILCGILLAHFYNFGSGLHHCMSWDWAFGNAAATVLYLHQPTILLATIVAAALLYVVAGYATRHINSARFQRSPHLLLSQRRSHFSGSSRPRRRCRVARPSEGALRDPAPAHPALTKQIGTIGALM